MVMRSQNKLLLSKVESSEGVDAAPAASDDAIKCANLRVTYNGRIITTDEHTGSLDSDAPLVGGMTLGVSCEVFLKGSGAAGTAPEFDPLLLASGMSKTVTGTAVPAAAEACGAGGTTTTAQLGSSASGTAQAYRGMPITLSEEVAGSSFITDYTAGKIATLTDTFAAIDADTKYQIPVNVRYSPSSGSIPSLTHYVYQDGKLLKVGGSRGRWRLALNAGGEARLFFEFTGILLESPTDVAVPSTPVFDDSQPIVFKNSVFKLNRTATPIQSLTLDWGNTLTNPDNPNKLEGFDPAIITKRDVTGSINPLAALVADRDALSDFRAGTQRIIHARLGATAGNRVGVTIPAAQYTGYGEGDREGAMTEELAFKAVGRDAGAFLTFY